MKTTIDIAENLLREAKRAAARQGTTLREIVESALRSHLAESERPRPFTLRDASVDGRGLSPGIEEGDWETLRSLVYSGRGG